MLLHNFQAFPFRLPVRCVGWIDRPKTDQTVANFRACLCGEITGFHEELSRQRKDFFLCPPIFCRWCPSLLLHPFHHMDGVERAVCFDDRMNIIRNRFRWDARKICSSTQACRPTQAQDECTCYDEGCFSHHGGLLSLDGPASWLSIV